MLHMALSPSALKKFSVCPRQFYATYITKEIPYIQSEAAQRGERLHALMERACKCGWDSIQWPELKNKSYAAGFIKYVQHLKDAGWDVQVEMEAAVSADGASCEWWDKPPVGFLRSRVDLCAIHPEYNHAIVIDWKTGKPWNVDTIQLAVNALCLIPKTQKFEYKMVFAYLDSGKAVAHDCIVPLVPFCQYSSIKDTLHSEVRAVYELIRMLYDAYKTNTWTATPNKFCSWCGLSECKFKK